MGQQNRVCGFVGDFNNQQICLPSRALLTHYQVKAPTKVHLPEISISINSLQIRMLGLRLEVFMSPHLNSQEFN
jgi:hypothetical protein